MNRDQEPQSAAAERLSPGEWSRLETTRGQGHVGLQADGGVPDSGPLQPGVARCGAAEITGALEEHLAVCNQLLALAQKESEALKSTAAFPAAQTRAERKALLNRLESALNGMVQKRTLWQQPGMESVTRAPQVARLLPACLDTIMRILVLDRENEQQLLRRGLLPARALPSAEQGRPHYVAGLYQRHGQTPAAGA